MSGLRERLEYHISKNRLEALVDGIFAIAMTLLVLGISPPKPDLSQAQAVLSAKFSISSRNSFYLLSLF